ncbi:zinc finger protein OZF isoform X4 [Pieris rapae]|uniref:zinc finger protein OZF isoform X4 n=1 Tax=Pieris rapae TaxID=64459 RepID=UPI001E27AC17|nr:zinc finger protein OZF isoform X4 [Pieris rapae]
MAEVITVKVEPDYYGENAEELKSDQHDYQNVCSEEIKIEEDVINTPQMNIDFVDVKSEVDTSIVKDEPQENDFILPDLDARDGPPLLGCGADEELNANALSSGKYSCDACHRGFDTTQFLTEHKNIHQKQNLECHMCLEKLPNREKYHAHINEHDSDGKFKCTQCTFGCKRKSAFLKHQKIHLRSFTCDNCDKNFVDQRNLTRHIENKRCKKPIIKCEMCDKEFDKTHLYKSHLRRHTTEKPFECNICGMALKYKSALVQHILRHSGNKTFKCDQCDKTFDNASAKKRHLSCHSGEKPFQCDICKKGFTFKHNMQTHMKRHSKKKNVQCMVCDKIFPRESRLIYHMRSHTNSRPFGCDLCVKKFFNKQNLIKHYKHKHPNASYTITTSDATVAKLVWQKIQKKLKEGGKFE